METTTPTYKKCEKCGNDMFRRFSAETVRIRETEDGLVDELTQGGDEYIFNCTVCNTLLAHEY